MKATICASLLFVASQALGHHRAAIFDTTRELELAGVVTKLEWAYRPDLTYSGLPCDPDNARQSLILIQ